MKKYLVFLDIDGVFTSNRTHHAHNAEYSIWAKFDPIAIDFMNKIHDTHNVKFVLMSTWKNGIAVNDYNALHWINATFASSGFRGIIAGVWKTGAKDVCINNRAEEVLEYLNNFGTDVEDYILFDDAKHKFDQILGEERLVHTDSDDGLLFKHMIKAEELMSKWEEK